MAYSLKARIVEAQQPAVRQQVVNSSKKIKFSVQFVLTDVHATVGNLIPPPSKTALQQRNVYFSVLPVQDKFRGSKSRIAVAEARYSSGTQKKGM
jgi:hypothetical protein